MKNIALTKEKKSGYTRRTKRKPPAYVTPNRGLWLRTFPEAAKWLHDYVLNEFYDGDRQRLASGNGLFTNSVMSKVEKAFHAKWPEVFEHYERTYGRSLYGKLIVNRVRFMYVHYDAKRKVDGRRSHEYRGVV